MAEAYEPDEQDQIVGAAMALGGAPFVARLHAEAADATDATTPWAGLGPEPAGRRAVWIAAARRVLARRRAELGLAP